jgi:hypothetical protein
MNFPQGSCLAEMQPPSVAVVLSGRQNAHEFAAQAIADCLPRTGALVRPVLLDRVAGRSSSYTLAALSIEGDAAKWRPVDIDFSRGPKGSLRDADPHHTTPALPVKQFAPYLPDRATISPAPGGLLLQTAAKKYAWAAMYPIVSAQQAGRYRFTLRYRPQRGAVAFGAYYGDGSKWLAVTIVPVVVGAEREMSIWIDLERGEEFQLRIASNNADDHDAAIVATELRCIRLVP